MSDHDLIDYLCGFVTEERLGTMRRVLEERTRYLSVVIEDIYQPHNASAVLRTCDCFGIQDVHIVENRNAYRVNPGVELGTAQWLSLHRYNGGPSNTPAAIDALRSAGYRIVATTPHTNQRSLADFDLEAGPVALLFGNELEGLSETAFNLADEHLVIPMFGFVESFNISVSAAIILHALSSRLRASPIAYHISSEERDEILLQWLRGSIGRVDALEREYHAQAGRTLS
jgi:tRNA (guanosine-2'-O-)-methyltransferase